MATPRNLDMLVKSSLLSLFQEILVLIQQMVANMMNESMIEDTIDVSRRLLVSLGTTDVDVLSRDDLYNLGKKLIMTLEPWHSEERCDPRICKAYSDWKEKRMQTIATEQKRTREEQLFDNIFQLVSQS